ncbi:MAG: HD domain-containing protein [Bacteroidota bacterium]|nr:HD domain-containing protein [Bacteroidota bacterium]
MNLESALKNPIFKSIARCGEELKVPCYVVGGFVRDHILRRKGSPDIDIVAVGNGIKLAQIVAESLPKKPKVSIYKNYGTAMVRLDGAEIEFVGARKESYKKESRNPEVFGGTLEDDQKRRDFTINAMAISLNSEDYGNLLDPFDGIGDLENNRIVTPLDPNVTFNDDPLRMLRAIRFATQLQFEIDPNALKAITKNCHRIQIITNERIVVELHKILNSPKPSIGFKILEKTGLLELLIPELMALKGIDEVEGQRHKDNFYHTLEVVDNIAKHTENIWLRWTALLHDIGKAPTKKFSKKVGWTFHGHELKGSKMVYHLFKRLKMPLNDKMKYVQKLVFMSSRPIAISDASTTDAAVRRLVFDAGDYIEDLMTLCEADITTKNTRKFKSYHNNFKLVRQKIIEVEKRDRIRNFQPPVSGDDIMRAFRLKPCPEIGIIKDHIKEAILEGHIPNEPKAAHALMLEKGIQLGLKST